MKTFPNLNNLAPGDLFLVHFSVADDNISMYYRKFKGYWMRVIANRGWSAEGDVVHYSAACFQEDNKFMPIPMDFDWGDGANLNWRPIWDFINVKRKEQQLPFVSLRDRKELPDV